MKTNLLKQAFKRRKDEMTEGIWNVDFLELIKNVRKWDKYDVKNAPHNIKQEFLADSIKHYNINQDLLNECSFESSKKMWLDYLGEDTKTELKQEKPKQLNEAVYSMVGIVKTSGKKVKITLPVSAKDEEQAEKKFKDMIQLQVKNGHLPKDIELISVEVKS